MIDKTDMVIASHESIHGDYDKLATMFHQCSKPLSKETQVEYIELYCSEDLRKRLLELV